MRPEHNLYVKPFKIYNIVYRIVFFSLVAHNAKYHNWKMLERDVLINYIHYMLK